MTSKIECPRCGGLSASFIQGVCRACYMRDYHQRRSATAVTPCPKCGVASANFVHGVCRACYMRDYHQRRSAAATKNKQRVFETPALIGDNEGQQLCVECKAPGIYARSLCQDCYMRNCSCIECKTPGIYARGLCRNCYVLDRQHRQRQRFCVECGAPGIYARSLCQNCYMRDLRRDHRIKRRACAVCGLSFQSVRRDALYCSLSCRQKAHRTGKTQLFPKAAYVDERRAVPSASEPQGATLASRLEVQAHVVADLDRSLGQIGSTVEDAGKRAPTDAVLSAIDGQRNARQVLPRGSRDVLTLADLQAERATLVEAAPIGHVAEPAGADTDGEWAIRWLLALMVLSPAIALTATESARNRPQSNAA
jgi:hypothetical protein